MYYGDTSKEYKPNSKTYSKSQMNKVTLLNFTQMTEINHFKIYQINALKAVISTQTDQQRYTLNAHFFHSWSLLLNRGA